MSTPYEGCITIDGVPIRDLNIKWIRNQIGFVQQEPILFEKTIKQNILYGSQYNQNGVVNSGFLDDKVI